MNTLNTVTSDWKWSDRFIPAVRKIVGPYLLVPASLELDRNQATDLLVLTARNLTIACRVRRSNYGARYSDEFTVRSSRPSGAKSEFEKIAEGFADLFFYGFADDEGLGIKNWSIVDLNAFRAHLIMNSKSIDHGERKNPDGTAFKYFRISSFPEKPPILIGKSNSQNINPPPVRHCA